MTATYFASIDSRATWMASRSDGLVADVVGEQQHQPRVEGGALRFAQVAVRLDDGGVERIEITDVRFALQMHGAPRNLRSGLAIGPIERRLRATPAQIARQRAATC